MKLSQNEKEKLEALERLVKVGIRFDNFIKTELGNYVVFTIDEISTMDNVINDLKLLLEMKK